ncbi:MAG: hypothetical protein K0S55_1388 [Clostridia bacterium]|nr:hypothetical protein [Clostridia bacterium]
MKKIINLIDNGIPVLTKGFGNCITYSLICGYEKDGRYSLGIVKAGDGEKNDDGYIKFNNRLDNSKELIFFGEKTVTPSINDSMKKSILNMLQLAHMSPTNTLSFGNNPLMNGQMLSYRISYLIPMKNEIKIRKAGY